MTPQEIKNAYLQCHDKEGEINTELLIPFIEHILYKKIHYCYVYNVFQGLQPDKYGKLGVVVSEINIIIDFFRNGADIHDNEVCFNKMVDAFKEHRLEMISALNRRMSILGWQIKCMKGSDNWDIREVFKPKLSRLDLMEL